MAELFKVKFKTTQPMIWNAKFYDKDQEEEFTVTRGEAQLLKQLTDIIAVTPCESSSKKILPTMKKEINNGRKLVNKNNGENI